MTRKGLHRSNPERDFCRARLETGERQLTLHLTSRKQRGWLGWPQPLQSAKFVARKSPYQPIGYRPPTHAKRSTHWFAIAVSLAFDEDVANWEQCVVDDCGFGYQGRGLVGQRRIPREAFGYAHLRGQSGIGRQTGGRARNRQCRGYGVGPSVIARHEQGDDSEPRRQRGHQHQCRPHRRSSRLSGHISLGSARHCLLILGS